MSPVLDKLRPAHRGYNFQDVATAYVFVRSLIDRYDEVIVDRKLFAGDLLDDLEVRAYGRRTRRQFKSSEDLGRTLSTSDFTAEKSSLRIDRLINSWKNAEDLAADEYRLCATWLPPLPQDKLSGQIVAIEASRTVLRSGSTCFRLDPDSIWPAQGSPKWEPLSTVDRPNSVERADFVAFCERFVIELMLPRASTDIERPGAIEQALLSELQSEVGIGRYPNDNRNVVDVAALVIRAATLARSNGQSVTTSDVERAINLRTDFGRVSQAYPLDRSVFHDRLSFRRSLMSAALQGKHQLVLGSPGSGKSWELTALANDLQNSGAVVARHYCYFQPGDEFAEHRVTGDVFVGNLIAEIVDTLPSVRSSGAVKFAAGLPDLEAALKSATQQGMPVVLIIDGLDHIARVRAESPSLSETRTDIIERLATLNLPEGVAIVLGSQPGTHLDPLLDHWIEMSTALVPSWEPADVVALASLHRVQETLALIGMPDEQVQTVLGDLVLRVEGNPLYARYLCAGLVQGMRSGTITSPGAWLHDAPPLHGNIESYYRHLYEIAAEGAQAIADIFGLLDFSVTEQELGEIVGPVLKGWIPSAVDWLSPILTEAAGQGGLRVFHESFRRFIRDELQRRGRSIADAMSPLITWLYSRGFLTDVKAYRFLIVCLARAGRYEEACDLVGISFVSDSLANGHPHEAMLMNIAMTATLAARMRHWATLVRYVELRRAALSVLTESKFVSESFWEAYIAIFSAAAASDRLLFEGRPVLNAEQGLRICAVIDAAGGVPPWQEYLDAIAGEIHFTCSNDGSLNESERLLIALIRGQVRTGKVRRTLKNLVSLLHRSQLRTTLIREIVLTLCEVHSVSHVSRLMQTLARKQLGLAPNVRAALLLGLADAYDAAGDSAKRRDAAGAAIELTDDLEIAASCVLYGARPEKFSSILPPPERFMIGLGSYLLPEGASDLRSWVSLMRLLAHTPTCHVLLDSEAERIAGGGWYRCWLRFVIEVAKVEPSVDQPDNGIVAAFNVLTQSTEPFAGKPRACDLYYARHIIEETLVWGLRFVKTHKGWEEVLPVLTRVSHETASSLQGSESGPLPTNTLLEILLQFCSDPVGGNLVKATIEAEYARRRSVAGYYTVHGDHAVTVARARARAHDRDGALDVWKVANICYAGYGMHKDTTIFELIDGARAIAAVSKPEALHALREIEPLVNAVVAHTDAKSTRHAPNALLRAVLDVDQPLGTAIAATTNVDASDTGGWPLATAVRDIAEHGENAEPVLLNALLRTVPFEVDADNVGALRAEERFAPIVRMHEKHPDLAREAAREAFSEIASTRSGSTRSGSAALRRALELSASVGFRPDFCDVERPATEQDGSSVQAMPKRRRSRLEQPAFAPNPSVPEILRSLRRVAESMQYADDTIAAWGSAITALGYRLPQMIEHGESEAAMRVVYFIARDLRISIWSKPHPLEPLATAFDETGYRSEAAVTYVLAYTGLRDDWGGEFGGPKYSRLLERALELDRELALDVLLDQVAYNLQQAEHGFGLTADIIERLASSAESSAAIVSWKEAYRVIAHRLPFAPVHGWFAPMLDVAERDWTPDESVVAMLLARISDPRISFKIGALRGLIEAIKLTPTQVIRPIRWWFGIETTDASRLLVLATLWHVEGANVPISRAIADSLFSLSIEPAWGLRRCARALLERAGIPTPVYVAAPPQSGPELDDYRRSLAEKYEQRLGPIASSMPDLAMRIAARIEMPKPNDQLALKPFYTRYELSRGREGKRIPPTPVLLLETERYVSALHREISDTAIQAVGERSVLSHALPRIGLHIGLASSRTPRPAWQRPSSSQPGQYKPSIVKRADADFDGWFRVALVEDEYLRGSDRWYDPPTERVTTFASVCTGDVPVGAVPFNDGDPNWTWSRGPAAVAAWESFSYPGAYYADFEDWLDHQFVLLPPRSMIERSGLRPPNFGEPLWWLDDNGSPAIVMRVWHVAAASSVDDEDIELQGSDLIVRPDVYEAVSQISDRPFVDEVRVARRRINSPSAD